MRRLLASAAVAAAAGCASTAEREVSILEGTHACRTPEETHLLWSLIRKDRNAAAQFSNERRCRIFAAGEKVVIIEPLTTMKISGVRVKGDPNVYYVPEGHAR